MFISLQKGQKVSLSKDNAGLSNVIAGRGGQETGGCHGHQFSALRVQGSADGKTYRFRC